MVISPDFLREVVKQAGTMQGAAQRLGIRFPIFKRLSIKAGVYKPNHYRPSPNQRPPASATKIPLSDILSGNHPSYSTSRLRWRLIEEGFKEHRCERCLNTDWMGSPIPLELDHKNGDDRDHRAANIWLLCPNCHALTPTHGTRNRAGAGDHRQITDIQILVACEQSRSLSDAFRLLGLTSWRPTFAARLREKYIGVYGSSDPVLIPKECPGLESLAAELSELSSHDLIPAGSIQARRLSAERSARTAEMISSSGIDFTRFGWVAEAAQYLAVKPQKVARLMRLYCPEFYSLKCFKRSRTIHAGMA